MKEPSREAIDRASSQVLDLARWISALLVVAGHVNARLFDFAAGAHHPAIFLPWRFAAGFGHAAVVVFFVLSGYLVGGKVIRETARGSFDARRYLIDRVTRIHLVLLPALALVALLDMTGLKLFGLPVYDADALRDHLSWTALLGNIASLQNFLVQPFGTDGPLGTLANEFWYYITFPLLAAGFDARYSGTRKGLSVLSGLALLAWLTALQVEHGIGFAVWLAGAAAAAMNMRARLAAPRLALAAFLLFVLGVRLGVRAEDYTILVNAVIDLPMAALFAWLLWSLRIAPWKAWPPGRGVAANAMLAGFSYSLYATHVPAINFLFAAGKHFTGYGFAEHPVRSGEILFALGAMLAALLAAYLFSLATERHTGRVRKAVYRLAGL